MYLSQRHKLRYDEIILIDYNMGYWKNLIWCDWGLQALVKMLIQYIQIVH